MAGAVAEQTIISMDQAEFPGTPTVTNGTSRDEFAARVDIAIDRAQRALLAQQHPEGYWQAALEANAEMNAEYMMFNRFMELPADPELDQRLSRTILDTQQGDGSWALFPG